MNIIATRTIREYQDARALKHVEELIGQHGPTPPQAEGELIAVLSTLIESYEFETIPRRRPTPAETLEHLIESKEVTKAEVARAHHREPGSRGGFVRSDCTRTGLH
jgi:antitoxin component HigA of HigAB toxin-antitoxin module